jgi:hypothetical protein
MKTQALIVPFGLIGFLLLSPSLNTSAQKSIRFADKLKIIKQESKQAIVH